MREAMTYTFNERLPLPEQIRQIQVQIQKLYYVIQGRVSFGTGVDGINGQQVSGQFQTYTSNVTPNTEDTLAHTVGSVPIGYIVMTQDKAGSVYGTASLGTAWTGSTIYLRCDVASVTFLLFLVKKGAV